MSITKQNKKSFNVAADPVDNITICQSNVVQLLTCKIQPMYCNEINWRGGGEKANGDNNFTFHQTDMGIKYSDTPNTVQERKSFVGNIPLTLTVTPKRFKSYNGSRTHK